MKVEEIDPLEEAALRIDSTMQDWQKDKGKEFEQELRERLGGVGRENPVRTPVAEEARPSPAWPAFPTESPSPVAEPRPMRVESMQVESAPTHVVEAPPLVEAPVVEAPPLKVEAIPAELKARPVQADEPAERKVSSPPQHAHKPRPKGAKGAVWAKHPRSRRGKKRKAKGKSGRRR